MLGKPGVSKPDGPNSRGRDRTDWDIGNGKVVTYERHPYSKSGNPRHDDFHYHINPAGGHGQQAAVRPVLREKSLPVSGSGDSFSDRGCGADRQGSAVTLFPGSGVGHHCP